MQFHRKQLISLMLRRAMTKISHCMIPFRRRAQILPQLVRKFKKVQANKTCEIKYIFCSNLANK